MRSTKRRTHPWDRSVDTVYSNRTQELRAAWGRFRDLRELKAAFKHFPSRLSLSRPTRRLSLDHGEYDRVWRGSAVDLYKCASQRDESVFTETHSDTVSHSGDPVPRLTRPQNMEDPPTKVSSSPYPSAVGALDNSSLNLCHRCAGINAESLNAEFGYEHGLLSELPRPDQLEQLEKWPNKSTGFCKLCMVFMNVFRGMYFGPFVGDRPDRRRLVLHLKGLSKEEMQDHDHFSASHMLTSHKTTRQRRWMDTVVVQIMNLDIVENLENYLGPRLSRLYPYGPFFVQRELGCFTDMDDPNVQFGVTPVRPVGDSTSSAPSFEVAAAWLSQCLAADPPEVTSLSLEDTQTSGLDEDCSDLSSSSSSLGGVSLSEIFQSSEPEMFQSSGPERPKRLLEIGSGPESGIVRLIETNKDEVPYATLSYCWGTGISKKESAWLTTIANVHSRRMGIQRSDLPKTLQDSISISEKLGIQYLWIDAVCIIQDSEDDWAAEASKMGGIYLGSLVTIVAATSSSAEHGCFNQRSVSTMEVLRAHNKLISIQSSLSDGRTSSLHFITEPCEWSVRGQGLEIEDVYHCQVNKGPWIRRAWTLQEHVLSKRILFYTSQMLLWECGHCRLSEDRFPQMQGKSPYPLQLLTSGAYRGPNLALTAETWYCELVEQYSRRQMTFDSDKMIAIGALAKATSWGRQIPYFAGLWGDSVRPGLLWFRDGHGFKSTATNCPSWSWASQLSPVSYHLLKEGGKDDDWLDFAPQVLDVHVEVTDMSNPFGDVRSGYVMLHTKLQTARVLRDFLGRDVFGRDPHIGGRGNRLPKGLFIGSGSWMSQWPARAWMDDEEVVGEFLVAVVGVRFSGPVVLLLSPPRLDADEYRRVGLGMLAYGGRIVADERDFKDLLNSHVMQWTTRTVKIV